MVSLSIELLAMFIGFGIGGVGVYWIYILFFKDRINKLNEELDEK